MRIKGRTVEERETARLERARGNRANTIKLRVQAAATGREVLNTACGFAQMVGKNRLNDVGRRELARLIASVVEAVEQVADEPKRLRRLVVTVSEGGPS